MTTGKGQGSTSEFGERLLALEEEGRLAIPVEAALELVERRVLVPDPEVVAPAILTPTPSLDRRSRHYVKGARFDTDEVARVVKCLRGLRHTKGRRWAGQPFDPMCWQVLWAIAPVFGWRMPDNLRIIRTVWIEIPRKNGKSTLVSGLLVILLVADGELGAEVYSAASSRDQARQVFGPAKAMVQNSPHLRGKVRALADVLTVPKTGGIFRVLSKAGDAAHGLNVSGAGIDEMHILKSRDLVDAIETGTGAREQPLIWLITTSDDGSKTTVYAEKREEIEVLALDQGEPDHEVYGAVWMAPEGFDPFAPETIRMANPGIGQTVHEDYLLGKARRAQRSPSFMPTYERLHLNRRRNAVVRAVDMDRWRAGCVPAMSPAELRRHLKGRRCWGGLDLATTEDFAAWCLVFPERLDRQDDKGEMVQVDGVWLLPRLWVPRAAVERRPAMRSTLEAWAEAGWMTIHDGDVIDFDLIEDDIGSDAEDFLIDEFAFDPWQAEMLRQHLVSGGLTGWKCGQTMERMSPATQEMDRLLLLEAVLTGGNPVLEWMASNVVAKRDGHGRWKPEKALSPEKIDGYVAACMGVASARRPDREEHHDPASAAPVAVGDDVFRPSGRLTI